MATKAQLEAELATLKAQLAQPTPAPDPTPETNDDAADETTADDKHGFVTLLKEHGIDPDDIEALWTKFSAELKDLPEQKPLVTAVAAFGLGFALGRMSKS